MNKESFFNQIVAQLREAQKKAEEARDAVQQEANSHVGRMESRYDTFKQEAQYEVEAQESRILEYQNGIKQIETLLTDISNLNPSSAVRVGSVVKLSSETGEVKYYILSPAGGGVVIKDGDISLFGLTPDAPLGKQLIGLKVGDTIESGKARLSVANIF